MSKHSASTEKTIGILFHNRAIASVFRELLSSRGVTAALIPSRREINSFTKIVTETRYYNLLSSEQQQTCLLVADRPMNGPIQGTTLEQPLTEHKVEQALELFLSESLQ